MASSFPLFLFLLLLLLPLSSSASPRERCLRQLLASAADSVTVGELRARCRAQQEDLSPDLNPLALAEPAASPKGAPPGVLGQRLQEEGWQVLKPFTLMAHRPNYLLVGAYNDSGYSPSHFEEALGQKSIKLDRVESQFQLSIKFPLLLDILGSPLDLYAAYTNRSFWQVFNDDLSSPFRETNHEPEVWLQFPGSRNLLGFHNRINAIGINHQSNGQGGSLSRSWNRIFAWFTLERGDMVLSFRPWIRIQESQESDDNPDMTDFLGHYELAAAYRWDEHVFTIMSRNNLESGFRRGAVELSWSFPLWGWPYLRGYLQYFNGYGESLIDYNQHANRIGIGFSLTDWL
ncbi:phospholipase A [Desulfogranum mediterraneum]|uniref:phospholipase A n=1 Tax=Desulfogranum mediterraneum TaxID=160661 RepID=UPI00040E9E30|nr:phospholipase A [Desulfogranum mediterraneum]